MNLLKQLQNFPQSVKDAARGIELVGVGNAARTVLYKPRYAWWRRRFGGPTGPGRAISPGNVVHVVQQEHGFLLSLEHGLCLVEAITPAIVRVRVVPDDTMPAYFSYATLPQARQPISLTLVETEASYRFETTAAALIVHKKPFGLSWEDGSGKRLSLGTVEIGWNEHGARWVQRFPAETWWYGLGERAVHLALERRTYHLTTVDPETYQPGDDPLYINIPFLFGVEEGHAFGILLDSTSDGEITLDEEGLVSYQVLGNELRFDLLVGPEPSEVLSRYAELTGHASLPPLWTLGYHQSRWSYETDREVRLIAREFRKRRIPCDAIHFDIDYMDGFRCFTWDKEAFPDLPGLIEELHQEGFKAVAMIDPGIKVDMNYEVCRDGVQKDVFCKLPDGSLFHGPVWPGECYFPDFTSPRVRQWWGQWVKRLVDVGFDGFWNDMNEPTIFGGATFPPSVHHDLEGLGAEHWQVHSAYGMQMVRATKEGLDRWRPEARNWVFTRSAYAGTQRYASSWTGDNRSCWEDLQITPAMLMNLGLSGLSFTGSDIGGFEGAPTPELYARWLSMAAFHPFFRTHSAKGTPWQEPWRFGERVEGIARRYIELRYRLLPAIYTLFWQYATEGIPMMRPMFFEDPTDDAFLAIDDQWLFGDHLLVAPVLEEGVNAREVLLPKGAWFDFWTDEKYEGKGVIVRNAPLDIVPLFIRAGAVLPMGPVQQFVGEIPMAPMTLHIYPGSGTSWLYEDDGESLSHRTGNYRITKFEMHLEGSQWRLSRQTWGTWTPPKRPISIIFHGASMNQVFLDDVPHSVLNNQLDIEDMAWQSLQAKIV